MDEEKDRSDGLEYVGLGWIGLGWTGMHGMVLMLTSLASDWVIFHVSIYLSNDYSSLPIPIIKCPLYALPM